MLKYIESDENEKRSNETDMDKGEKIRNHKQAFKGSYIVRHQDDLLVTFTEPQKEIFEKLKDCESELHGMNELQAFSEGFKLVARLLIEVMRDNDRRQSL